MRIQGNRIKIFQKYNLLRVNHTFLRAYSNPPNRYIWLSNSYDFDAVALYANHQKNCDLVFIKE